MSMKMCDWLTKDQIESLEQIARDVVTMHIGTSAELADACISAIDDAISLWDYLAGVTAARR